VLLNSHHDTVKPNNGYTLDPFEPIEKDGKLYGLGSNDAGGALVALLSVFVNFYEAEIPFNLIFAGTAEEEISGQNGVEILLNHLPKIDCAIVGEPTLLNMAVAEKGLLVLALYGTWESRSCCPQRRSKCIVYRNERYKLVEYISISENIFSFRACAYSGYFY